MKVRHSILTLGALALAFPSAAAAQEAACIQSAKTNARDVQRHWSREAVEIVKRASSSTWRTDPRLSRLVRDSAPFTLGSGDVGRELGSGVRGAHALAKLLNADTYRFLGWDYMLIPADICSSVEVEVEFVNSRDSQLARVKFTFERGQLVKATGWERSFESGRLRD
jgi:hypothetical protein